MKAWEIWNPAALGRSDMRELFNRAFANPKFGFDFEAVLDYLRLSLGTPERPDRVFVAQSEERGLCGLSIVTISVSPLSPLPWVTHFYAEAPGAREALTVATLNLLREKGHTKIALHNETGATDEAHMRLFRRHVSGEVLGSLIVYDLENPNVRK